MYIHFADLERGAELDRASYLRLWPQLLQREGECMSVWFVTRSETYFLNGFNVKVCAYVWVVT